MPSCFIIMPITVRKDLVAEYHGGESHFTHVLRHLFAPAVEKAGYNPISPRAKGSEMIHGEIIANLQTADLVLCDMSTLNANVFMELGIRTSLNKPVCLVKDDKTQFVPFDATVLNHHTYNCLLDPWVLEKEVPALADHINASFKTCKGANPLWKYFGLTITATPPEGGSVQESLALLAMQVQELRSSVLDQRAESPGPRVAGSALITVLGDYREDARSLLERIQRASSTAEIDEADEALGRITEAFGRRMRAVQPDDPVSRKEIETLDAILNRCIGELAIKRASLVSAAKRGRTGSSK